MNPDTASAARRIVLGGCPVDLHDNSSAIEAIVARTVRTEGPPLGVVSVNLDHLHHVAADPLFARAFVEGGGGGAGMSWLHLIDGAPLAAQAERLTGTPWPRLAGSDLIGPLLERAADLGMRVGVLGGTRHTQEALAARLATDRPELALVGLWSPDRPQLGDEAFNRALAAQIADVGVDVLIVGLGKPRQERWIADYGVASGARVLLAFGAVVDFLGGSIQRAPEWVARSGLEWLWRLSREPRRLARRYLVNGPPAYRTLRRHSTTLPPLESPSPTGGPADATVPASVVAGTFSTDDERVQVAVVVVTYNNADDIEPMLESLRHEARDVSLRVVIVDNDSTDGTLAAARAYDDVIAVPSGGNLGYAGGINAARRHLGDADSILILNPDLVASRGSIAGLYRRMTISGAAVVVPRLIDSAGERYPSLRREPTIRRAFGDALFGSRWPWRAGALAETVFDAASYRYAHPVDWATGAAVLISREAAEAVGPWDERFFLYSEETDFLHRIRDVGGAVLYEPAATMRHRQGGSGASDELVALMVVNRVRYIEKHRSRSATWAFHRAVIVGELLRSRVAGHRIARRVIADRAAWGSLPAATLAVADISEDTGASQNAESSRTTGASAALAGTVIIPAHNEAEVIERVLAPLAPLVAAGRLRVVVACNGCTDGTAERASRFPGVSVLSIPEASKVAALNAADALATGWPRLYLDADIEITADAVVTTLSAFGDGRASGSGAVLAARPSFRYETRGASGLVRAYYRARQRMPSTNAALWGAGSYAINEAGHARFARFPELTGDDLFVDGLFTAEEKRVVPTPPVVVRTPLTPSALLGVLRRNRRGVSEQGVSSSRASLGELFAAVHGPLAASDALVYAAFAIAARAGAPSGSARAWERDDTSRGVTGSNAPDATTATPAKAQRATD